MYYELSLFWRPWSIRKIWLLILITVVYCVTNATVYDENVTYMCESEIYCRGPILEATNRLAVYTDPKDFVDMPLKQSPNETLLAFHATFSNTSNITKEELLDFVQNHFFEPNKELLPHSPVDYRGKPASYDLIKDTTYKEWAYEINKMWMQLCKKVNQSVSVAPERHSMLYVPYPFIIPGGRFREFYNWDTYFIQLGLMFSEMFETTKHIIKNFKYLIETYGLVPNGGRVYYLRRSHPPMFSKMVYRYWQEKRDDRQFVLSLLPQMERELNFWLNNRSTIVTTKSGINVSVFHFDSQTSTPRPESYSIDIQTAMNMSEDERPSLYSNIAAGAETGWDFTSRFLSDRRHLDKSMTKHVWPVDLNSYMCENYRILAELFKVSGSVKKAALYEEEYEKLREAMMTVFYNETEGCWFDVDSRTLSHNTDFYLSNLVPLYSGCYSFSEEAAYDKIMDYFLTSGALQYPNGIPASMTRTGQQWDFPNSWPPLNHMIIEGFEKTGRTKLKQLAFQIADVFLRNTYLLYQNTSSMYEKYDVENSQQAGSGGEYEVQVGFGWTNGVVLHLLRKYGDRLKFIDTPSTTLSSGAATALKFSQPLLRLFSCLSFALWRFLSKEY